MIRYVCAVFDSAAGTYGNPVFSPAVGQVLREFSDQVNSGDKQSPLVGHPEDFALWLLAVFDDEQGTFTVPDEGKRCLARAQDLKRA